MFKGPSASPCVAVSDNMLSTAWNPAYIRDTRPANPEDLVAKGCCCADTPYKFHVMLHHGCLVAILRPKASTDSYNVRTFLVTLRHDMMSQVLSSHLRAADTCTEV